MAVDTLEPPAALPEAPETDKGTPPLQSIIRNLNETKGVESPKPPEPTQQTTPAQEPKPTPEPQKPAQEPKKEEVKPTQASTIKPAGSTEAPPTEPATEPKSDEIFINRLSELTDGGVKTVEDFGRLIDRYNQLEEEAAKGFEPKFKDERAKLVYQLLEQNTGNEPAAAMRILRALDFKREGKTEKDILFEAFLVDPKNADLTPMKAQEYFELDFDKKYAEVENSPLMKRELELEAKAALAQIEKVQSDFKNAEQEPAARNEKVEQALNGALGEFGGIKLAFSDNPTEADFLNVAVEDPAELQAIREEILNPADAHNKFLEQFDFTTRQGYDDYVREVYERRNHVKIREEAYKKGVTVGELRKVNELRNASAPGDISRTTPAAAGTPSFQETWLAAEKAAGR